MALMWGLAAPLPAHLSLILLGFLVYGTWVLFSRYQNQGLVAAKTEGNRVAKCDLQEGFTPFFADWISKQHDLKQIQKLTASQLEKAGMMNIIEADPTCISGLPMGWTQEYVFQSINRSLQQIFQHLENARSTLTEMSLPESRDMSSSSVSDIVGREAIPSSCYCKMRNRSSDSSVSSVSSKNSSNPSYLPISSEGTTWQFQSHSLPAFSGKEPSSPGSQDSSLPTFQLADIGPNSVLNESPEPLVWDPLQLSPLVRGELEAHISQKVSTLRAQVVPLPVKKSWETLNHLMDVQGVPEQGLPKTQLPTLIPQSAEENTNRSPDAPSFHVHVNIGVNSELSRTEVSQPLTSNKQLQSENDSQVLRHNPLIISMGTLAPMNRVQEENALLRKDAKHVVELNIEQRVLGLPEKRTQPQRAQVTDVELTPQVPHSATDSIKVTPVALLQVMGSMEMIPESHAQVIDCMGFPPKPPNQAETVLITPRPSDQVIEPKTVTSLQHPTTESKSMASRLKVTPVALLHFMDSMGMINDLHPRVIEPAGIAPKPQYQVMESAMVDTLHGHQAIRPRDRSLGLQQSVLGTVEVIPQPQPKVMGTRNMTLGPQNQATKNIGITPGPIQENIMEISSSATPGAQQTMDFMQVILPGPPHVTEPRALIKTENLTPLPAQPDVLTSTFPIGAAELRGVPPQLPSKVLESAGVIQLPSGQTLHALKLTSIGQVPPGVGTIPPLQVVEPPGLTPQPVAQVKEPLDLPSGLQGQVGDSVGMTPQHQGTEYVSLTSGLSQQVMDPSKFTPCHQDLHYSEVSPRQSHKMTETMGGTSDTWPQMKNSVEMTELPNQKMESVRTVAAPLDKGTIPIGRSQKHHVTEAEVVPVTPLLQEMEHLGENAIPQPKVMDSTNLPPELQNIKSEHLIPDQRLQSMKSVDTTMDLVPEKVKYGPPTSRVVSTDLTPELHQQTMQFEELTPMPQLQSEESAPSAPESQLQDLKSGQVIVEPQLQNIQSAGLSPDPQLQSNKSVHLTPGSQTQSMEGVVHSALSQELQGDTKMVELAPRPSLEDNLTQKPYSQNTSFEKTAHVPLLEDTKTLLVEGRSLIPEALVESVNLSESVPSTHLYALKSLEVNPDPSYHFLEPEELTLQHQALEERVGSDVCHQVEESVELTKSLLGMTPAPLSQTSDSMQLDSSPLQETLETRNQVVKEMEETPDSQNAINDALDLLPESEVQNMNSVVMAPEPQPPGVKFLHGTLESCSEVTNTSEITLRPEYEARESTRLALPKADDTQGAMIEPYSKMGSLELGLEPGVQGKKSQHLKSAEGIREPPVLAVEPTALTTGPKPHIKDVIPGPQLHEAKQMDTESQLQNEKSVNVTQQSSIGEVGPEKTEPGPQSPSPKELIEETQAPKVKPVDLNLGPQQLSIKSGLIPGPQLQSVRFPTLYQGLLLQGGKPGNFISGSPHYGMKSDEALSCPSVPEIRSSDFIPGLNLPGPKLQHVKPVEVNVGPCLQDVKFSDLIPEPKHQGFKCTQVIPGVQFQDRKSQGLKPESFLSLSQEPQVEDRKLVLPMEEVSEFHGRKHTMPASELQYPSVISEEINPELQQQDTKFSELASRLRLQGVRFGEQTPGPLSHGMRSMTPELEIHNPKLAKMTPEPNDTKQASFNSGPWLQNVKFFDGTPGTQSQGVTTSELYSGPQLECVKMFEFITQPERQGMKPELIQETLFEDRKYITRNQVPSFEDEMSYKLPSEPQTPMAESMRLTPGIHLASVDHSKLVGRPQAQSIESSESISGQHLGHRKPVEKVTASKQEELTPVPHLEDVKSMELRSKSELGKVKSILLTPGIQAGDKEPKELPPGPNLKDLKSELLPSRPQLENKKSAVLTLGQCLERIKSSVVSPCSSQSDGIKIVKLISGSTIEDMKTVGLAHDTHVQDVSAMGLKLEPKKQEESPVTFVPEIRLQNEFMEMFQGPQLPGTEPKKLTSQSQMQDTKHVIISYLKPKSLKPVNIAKTQRIPGVKFVNLVSTQPYQGLAPTDLTLKPGQDDQITVRSPEWEGGVLDQLSEQFESGDVLSMKSGQEVKPADKKPKESNFKVQFKDTPSFELTPEAVVHSVKPEEVQGEPQVPSMKPCQVTPGPQGHQVKVSEPTLEPPFQDVKTTVLTEPQIGSTKSVRWIPISEFQNEKWVESDFRLQSQSARPTELKPSIQWRGVRPSELTVRSKIIQEKKSVGFHLEPQSQQVKTSPLTLGLQKTKSFNLTSEPQPQGIKTVDQNKDLPIGSVRFVQWIPGPVFHGVKCLGLNHGSQSQGVKSTERKTSIQLGGVKPSETAVRPKLQGEKSVGFNLKSQVHHMKTPKLFPEPELQKGENITFTSEPQPQGIKTVAQNQDPPAGSVRSIQWIPGPEFHSVKYLGLNRGSQSQGVKSTEQKPSIQLGGVKPLEMTVEPKLQGKKSVDFNRESNVQHIKTPEDTPEPESQEGENSEPQAECIKSVALHHGSEPQAESIKSVALHHGSEPQAECIKSVALHHGSEPQAESIKSVALHHGSEPQAESIKSVALHHGSEPQAECIKSVALHHGSEPQAECIKSVALHHGSEPQAESIKSVALHHGSEPQAECIKSVALHHGSEPQAESIKSVALHHGSEPQAECIKSVALHHGLQLENTKSVQWIPASGCQAKKSMLNLRLHSEDVTAKELNPLAQLRNVKTSSELTTRPKLQSKQPSGSTLEEQSHGFKTIDFKSELQFRSMKGCDPNLKSKINNIKFSFKPRFHLEGTGSPGLNPGMQPQEVKPLGSPPGTQPQSVTSLVFKQESQASEVNYGVLSQGPQPQSNMELKSAKSSELALQTKPWGMKSEINSGSQWQSAKCSDLTPETESQNMKCITSSQGKPFLNRSVKLDFKHGPQWKGIKSSSVLRTKSQEMEMEDCESGPQLQDLKSSRTIMGIKVQDVKSMGFTPGPHLRGMTSEVLTEKRVHGVKFVESKPSSELQGKKPDFTPRKKFLGTKLVELDSAPPLQDLKYPEQILDMKLQGVNSTGHQVTSIKSSELVTQIKSQGIKAMDFNSGPQPQNKKPSELAHGEKLQGMKSLTVESKSPNGESVALNSGPQLQDEKSKSILGMKHEDSRPTEVSSSPSLQGMKSSEVFSEDMLQGEKPPGFVAQPLWQDVKSLRQTFCKALDRKLLQLKTPQFQGGKGSMLTPELYLQGMEPETVKPGSKLKGVQPEPTNVQAVKNIGINHGAELQVVGFAEQDSDSTIYSVVPSELSARSLKQNGKFHKLNQKQQLQSIKPVVFSHEPHLQHRRSSKVCTKLQDLKSTEFNSEQQLQEIKAPEVCTESKLPDESTLEFKHDSQSQGRTFCDLSPGPQIHCKNIMTSNTGTQNVELSKLHPYLDLQGIKSKEFCLGSHLEDVNSACTPNANSQYTNSSDYKPWPYLQNTNFSECIPEPDPRCINSVCNPGPHFNGMNSVCILGTKLQCVDSTGCNHELNLQDVNSSACTSVSSPTCVNSSVCTPEPSPPCVNSSVCTPGLSPPCVNSSICTPEPSPPCVNFSVCTPGPSPPCENSSVCTPEPSPPCVNSSVCTPGPSPLCVNSSICTPEPSPPCVNSSVCTPGPSPPCVNSSICTPEPSPPCVNSSVCTPGPSPPCVNSSVCTPGPSPPCVNSSVCTPEPSPPCVNSSVCTPGPTSVCTPGPSPPCVNSSVCTPEPSPPCVNSSVCTPEPSPPCVNSTECNPKAHFRGVNSNARTPGKNPQCKHSNRYKLGPLLQGMHSGTFPAPQIMCVNPVWCSVQTHLQNVNSSACSRRQESQPANSMGYNAGPHLEAPKLQGMKFSELNPGTGIQREMPTTVNPGQHLQDLKLELTSGSHIAGITAAEYNPGSQEQDTGCGLQDLRSKEFSPGPCFQTVRAKCLKPGSQSQSGNSSEFAPSHRSQCAQSFFAPKPCLQDLKPMQLMLGSQQQSMNHQQIAVDETPMVVTLESTRKSLAGPALTSVKFSNLIPELQPQCMKSTKLTSEPRGQNVKHVKLSSVSLPQSGNSVGLSPGPFLQNVTFGNQIPQTYDQITEPSKVTCRPAYHLVDYAEMNTKIRYHVPKPVNFISLPVYQEDAGSSEMTKGLGHESSETTEKSMRLTHKPTDKITESLGMPQHPNELQVPEFVDLTPTLSDQDSNSSELTPQKNYQSLETLELLSCSWPHLKDFKQLQTQPATGSKRMTLDLKNHVTETTVLTCKARQQGKEFFRVTSPPVNRETECAEKSPRPYPQDLGPVVVNSKKRSPREQSVVSSPRPFYHVPDSAPGITQGPQIPESVDLTSKPWLEMEEFLELSTQQTNQVVGNLASVELTFEECQTEEVVSRLTKPQNASIEKASITSVESLDQIINFVRISPKPLDQMTESAKTQLQIPQSVSESVTVIPGPPLQVIESVMIPEPTSQGSKYVDLTPKLHGVIVSEFAPRLWLQNVQSKKLIAEPTHQILETIELSGFQVIKTVLLPKPLLLMVKSEELAPGPSPQAVEPIGIATRSRIKVKDSLNLLPRPHLQDKIKPIERTQRANIQENFTELILQQTSPLEEPPVLPHKQRLQAERSVGIKTEFPKVLETDLNQGRVCQNSDSEMITSEKLQAENYFSRFVNSPPIPFISSSVKTAELGPLQGSGMPEVSRAWTLKNFNAGSLRSPESSTDTIMIRPTALPLVLPSEETENSRGTLYPEIWGVDVITKEATEKKQMEEFGNSLQSYSPYPLRLLPPEFQAGLGARRNSIRSSLGRQLNIWESHVCRQRLPRKYLSNMLMLGNVLGTTMERKLCSQPFLTEGATMDICRAIQNLFGVPAELMEFSQSLLERGPRTISQTSVVKSYIQRHILWHGHEKRMPLKMWTRGSTSSIIQQYSGTRLGLKKTSSKLSDIFQEATQHVPVSCTGAQFPALGKPESPLRILYDREDPVSRESSKNSQSDSQTRTFESHCSHKGSYFSQTETEQLHLLKDLQLKIAAKLLRSQLPHNVPPPPESGLVLKYPICLQCGQCSGFRCCHKLQSDSGAYLLVYPQIHLKSTPEGRGDIQLRLGFRLSIGKRPQVSKYHGRKRADTLKNPASPSRREAKLYTPASKSPTSIRDFQSGSSQSPASVQVHRRQKQWDSLGAAGKTETKDSGLYEFCEVLSMSESGFESNRDEKWAKSRLRKTSDLKYLRKKITKEYKTQITEVYKNSRPTEENPSGTLADPSRRKNIETAQTSTASSKRQPKKSSQPKFIQLLFQGLKQAFQRAHRMMAITGQKPEDRTSSDNLWSSKDLNPKENDEDDCLTRDGKGASTPLVKQRFTGSTPKQEDRLQETCNQAQQPKQVSALQIRPLELKNMVSDVFNQATSILQPMNIVRNSRAKKNYEISSPESKNCSKVGAKFQAQETLVPDSLLKRTVQSHFKHEQEQDDFFRDWAVHNCNKPSERTYCSLSERPHRRRHSPQRKPRSPSDRTLRNLSERRHSSLAQRKDRSPSRRTPQSLSDRSPPRLSEGRGRSPSGRRQPSPSGRRPRSSSGRSPCSSTHSNPRERRGHNPSPKGWLDLYGRNQHSPPFQRCRSPSKRSHLSPIRRTLASPSEWSHSNLSERPPSRPSGRKRHSSSGRGYHSPSRSRPSGLYRSHSQRTHYSPSESRGLERNQQGHHARPHNSPKGRLRHSSPEERPRNSLSKEFKTY